MQEAPTYHIPVLRDESIRQLITDPDGLYIDATFGGGGHSAALLRQLGSGAHLFGVDRDLDARKNCTITDSRFTFVRSDFRYIGHFMAYFGIDRVDGILADLGVSSHHLDDPERGFSFRFDAPIDMRMNQAGGATAAELIQTSSVEDLARILKEYGEVRGAWRVATLIKQASDSDSLHTIQDLLDAIAPANPPHDKKGLARIFQALRIAVNDELGALRDLLSEGQKLLKPGGHFAIITYHSLEDRPVKNFFRTGNIDGIRHTDHFGVPSSTFAPLYSKPTLPTESEIASNPRSRSAKLRTGVRTEEQVDSE